MRRCVLGIDIGTSGCKIIAVDEEGKIINSVREDYPCYTPREGWSEQDPEDWWNGVKCGLKEIQKFLPNREISAISFSTTGLNRYASTIATINGIIVLSAADHAPLIH